MYPFLSSGFEANDAAEVLRSVSSRLECLILLDMNNPLSILTQNSPGFHLQYLKELHLENCSMTPESFDEEGVATIPLERLEVLEILDLEILDADERETYRLALHPEVRLKKLEVNEVLPSCQHSLSYVQANLTQLETLTVPSEFFVRDGLSLSLTPNLVTLTLTGLHPDLSGLLEETDTLPHLRKVSLDVSYPEEDLIKSISRLCPSLDELALKIASGYRRSSDIGRFWRLKDKDYLKEISPFPCEAEGFIDTQWMCSRTVDVSGKVSFVRL